MNWSSLTLRSCYIPLIHTPLCCKTLEQHFVHLPLFVCILPHFSLTEHPFLCRQGYYYIPPLTDRKTETLQRLEDNLPSHISANGNRKQVSWLVGRTAYSLSLDKYNLQNHAPSTPNTWLHVSTRNTNIFFSWQIQGTALRLDGGSFIIPGGPQQPPSVPR